MNFKLEQLLRPHLKGLQPYSTARDEFKGVASIYLDANENPFSSEYNRYPDPAQIRLKEAISQIKNIDPSRIILGNGSDELIDLVFRAFCEKGENVIIPQPTYGMYVVSANINGISVKAPPLTNDFDLDLASVGSVINELTKLILICSPNNPTGNLLSESSIVALLKKFNGIVVLDEAYIDFSESQGFLPMLDQYPNLIVLQTFSKAWGLAGLRLGAGYASPEIIQLLNKIKPPYNINAATQKIGLDALSRAEQKEKMVEIIKKERKILTKELLQFSFITKVYSSDANFLLVQCTDSTKCYQYLLSKGIIVRDRSSASNCENCLRISIGIPAENEALLKALNDFENLNQ